MHLLKQLVPQWSQNTFSNFTNQSITFTPQLFRHSTALSSSLSPYVPTEEGYPTQHSMSSVMQMGPSGVLFNNRGCRSILITSHVTHASFPPCTESDIRVTLLLPFTFKFLSTHSSKFFHQLTQFLSIYR